MTTQEFVNNNYEAALVLLTRHQPKLPVLETLRKKGPNAFNQEKLAYLLDKHGISIAQSQTGSGPIQTPHQNPSGQVPVAPHDKPVQLPAECDVALLKIANQRKDLFKIGSFLHANKLDNDKLSSTELKKVCFEILDIYDNQIPALDAQEKFIRANFRLPDGGTPTPASIDLTDKYAVNKRIDTLKKNISRDKVKYPDRAARYQAELEPLLEVFKKM